MRSLGIATGVNDADETQGGGAVAYVLPMASPPLSPCLAAPPVDIAAHKLHNSCGHVDTARRSRHAPHKEERRTPHRVLRAR